MKAKALVKAWSDAGITCLVQQVVDLPLKAILEDGIHPMESCRLDLPSLGAPVLAAGRGAVMHPMHVEGLAPVHFGQPGLLLALNPLQACRFLESRWIPSGNGPIDSAVRAVRESSPDDCRRYDPLLAFIEDLPEGWLPHPDPTNRAYPVLLRSGMWGRLREVERGGDPVYLPKYRNRHEQSLAGRIAVVRQHRVRRGDVAFSGWDVMMPSVTRSGRVRVCLDGHWSEGALRQIDRELRIPFEEDGRLVEFLDGDATQFGAWIARVLVKVPRRWPRKVGEVPPAAGCLPAAWLVDSRCPLQIPDDVSKVDRPAEAAAILSRVTRNVFLPDGIPGRASPAIRARADGWLALCTPPDGGPS